MSSIPLVEVRLQGAVYDGKRMHSFLKVNKQDKFAPVEITLRPDLLCVLVEWPNGKMTLVPLTNCKDAMPGVSLKKLDVALGLLGQEVAVQPEGEDVEDVLASEEPDEGKEEKEMVRRKAKVQKKKRGRPPKVR